jgi:hypothetical protein
VLEYRSSGLYRDRSYEDTYALSKPSSYVVRCVKLDIPADCTAQSHIFDL